MNHQMVSCLRESYPTGCRVMLDNMEDIQAPPIGTLGTVRHIDDMGTIHVAWDNGSSLGVVWGADSCHRIEKNEKGENKI